MNRIFGLSGRRAKKMSRIIKYVIIQWNVVAGSQILRTLVSNWKFSFEVVN